MAAKIREFLVSYPGCKTFETVWVRGDILLPIMRFKQRGRHIYHDCSLTDKPCRLFPKYIEGKKRL